MRQLEVYVNNVKAGMLTELNPGRGYTFAKLVGHSFLNDKMKRNYLRIVDERVKRFIRKSE